MPDAAKYVRRFEDITGADVPLVGGKNASLGEMYRELRPRASSCRTASPSRPMRTGTFSTARPPGAPLRAALDGLNPTMSTTSPGEAGAPARSSIRRGAPEDLQAEILAAHHRLVEEYGPELTVAVRSSATAEDLPNVSFAGQHESYLNVGGGAASSTPAGDASPVLFTDRAIHYRIDQGFDHFKVFLVVGVMKMVRSDLAASGRHLLARHGVRIPRRRPRHRRLRPRRERRTGRGRSRRVLRPQTDVPPGLPGRPAPALGDKAADHDLRDGRRGRHHPECAHARRPSPALLHHRRGGPDLGRLRAPHRGALQRPGRTTGHGHRVGQGRHRRRSSTSSRPGRRPWSRRRRRTSWRSTP